MKVCIAVSCYKRPMLTKWCVPASIETAGMEAEWRLVDDGSADETADILKGCEAPNVDVTLWTINRGHYVRRNEGFEWGLKQGADVVVNLDNDMLTPNNWLRDFVAAFEPTEFGVGTAWVINDKTLRQMIVDKVGKPLAEVPSGEWIDIGGCGGACIAHKRAVLEAGCRYVEGHPLFCYGDANFNGIVRNAGFKIGLYTGVQVYHVQPMVWADRDYERDKLARRHLHQLHETTGWEPNADRQEQAAITAIAVKSDGD